MSEMESLGLPDQVLDILLKQKDESGVELEWTISGSTRGVEVKLSWRPRGRGPSKENGRRYKSPGNMRRDYFRMKRMLTDLNSVAVGTEDLNVSETVKSDIQSNVVYESQNEESTISTPFCEQPLEYNVPISCNVERDITTCCQVKGRNDIETKRRQMSVSETENVRDCSYLLDCDNVVSTPESVYVTV